MKNKDKEPKKTAAAAVKPEEARTQEFKLIPYDQVRRSEGNPRKTFDEAELKELASTILDQGIIQPLVVRAVPQKYTLHEPDLVCKTHYLVMDAALNEVYRAETESAAVLWAGGEEQFKPYYELLAGERRYRAAGIAGLKELPCMVRTADEIDAYKVRLMENDQRVNLNDLERAKHYQKGIEENGFTADTLAQTIKKSRSHVFGMLALLRLSEPLREALQDGKINKSIAERIAQIPEPKQQEKLLKEILKRSPEHPMSVRDVEREIEFDYMVSLERAKFDVKKDSQCGSCTDCPKRTGNMTDLFPNLKASPNICTDPQCFQSKTEWHGHAELDKAEERGLKTIPLKQSENMFSNGYLVYTAPYVKADVAIPGDAKGRTYRQVLKKTQVYAAMDGTGELQELFSKEEARAALEKAGVKASGPLAIQEEILPETAEEKRKRTLQAELTEKIEHGTGLALVDQVAGNRDLSAAGQKTFWWKFVLVLIEMGEYAEVPTDGILQRRNIPKKDDLDRLEWFELRGLAMELVLTCEDYRSNDENYYCFVTARTEMAAKLFKLDVKAVEKRIKAEFAEANRLPKEGEKIPYTGDSKELEKCSVVMKAQYGDMGDIHKFRGYLWVETGADYGPKDSTFHMMQIVPAAEYTKQKFSYAQKSNATDKTKLTMGYEGIVLKSGKEQYVLTGPTFHFVAVKAQQPEAKAEKKTTKKKK